VTNLIITRLSRDYFLGIIIRLHNPVHTIFSGINPQFYTDESGIIQGFNQPFAALTGNNPEAIKTVNMAFLTRSGVICHDPGRLIKDRIPGSLLLNDSEPFDSNPESDLYDRFQDVAGVYVDDKVVALPDNVLILRPKSLAAGIGCNRNTSMENNFCK